MQTQKKTLQKRESVLTASRTSIPEANKRLVKSARNVVRRTQRINELSARPSSGNFRKNSSQYPLTTAKKKLREQDMTGSRTTDIAEHVQFRGKAMAAPIDS